MNDVHAEDVLHESRENLQMSIGCIHTSVYTDCITNFKVCNICKQEDIMVKLAQRKWTWIGHVIRKDHREKKQRGALKRPGGGQQRKN